ncbi:MAG: DUF2851 family protein, partial [Hymenobacteraceae bacterium]|nr:DUF2851 family protein [Hymenobacteraceae bacterium]
MKEDFLHYIWQFQYFDKTGLCTTDGQPLTVLKPGYHNTNAGPDFTAARIRIGDIDWTGCVEVHIQATDWFKHRHQQDEKYDQVILHVVWEADTPVQLSDKTALPTLELKNRISDKLLQNYHLLSLDKKGLPCEPMWPTLNSISKTMMLERALVERLQQKGDQVLELHRQNNYDWEETAYQVLLRSFGFKINQEGFSKLAQQLPYNILRRHRHSVLQLEALLLGQAGFLEEGQEDEYLQKLRVEYKYLQHKYKLQPLAVKDWNMLRMRPANFPPVRLAQLAMFLHRHEHLFSVMQHETDLSKLEQLFKVQQSAYWQKHYLPGRVSARKLSSIGRSSIHNLIINTVVPLQAAFARFYQDHELLQRGIYVLQQLLAENNHITRLFLDLGV